MPTTPILDALTREGVLIDVSVRYWRAAKKLRPEDLGLNPDRVTDRLISLAAQDTREILKRFWRGKDPVSRRTIGYLFCCICADSSG